LGERLLAKEVFMPAPDKFQWAKRVSRRDIQRLYESDASGLLDEELLERVHFAVYARVCDMFEVHEAQQTGSVRCRSCGERVPEQFRLGPQNRSNPLKCTKCGWEATCGELYQSYTGKSLLPGSVPEIFAAYLERFKQAHLPAEKMLLIDWLIHQFHVMQGVARMPVAENVIQGSGEQVRELIENLAGSSSTEAWRSV
jgi:hypothetical protein